MIYGCLQPMEIVVHRVTTTMYSGANQDILGAEVSVLISEVS